MKCDNCGKREANVRYSENINGVKRELNLCEECSQKLGIGNMNFSIPIDFSSFFGDFMEDFRTPEFMPLFNEVKDLKCDECGYTFEDIANSGKLGCAHCYDIFEDRLDPIIKRIQGSNRHIGRIGKISDNLVDEKYSKNENIENNTNNNLNGSDEVSKLKENLKQAIKEERYEDAAQLRDEISKKENEKND